MAMRIPEETVNQIRQGTNIVDVVSQYVQLKKSGKNLFGFCPFHEERTPSFSVAEEKQIFHCFSCGRGGNVFTFLMEVDGLSFPEAVIKTAEMSHIQIDNALLENRGQQQETDSKRDKLIQAHEESADLFQHVLLNTKIGESAYQYLLDRGLTKELIETFKIGFAPHERNMLHNYLVGKEYEEDLLSETGLFVQRDNGDLLDRFYNRIMFPIRNQQGKTIAFSGRIFQSEAEEHSGPKYLNSPETYLFNKRNVLFNFDMARATIRRDKEVILFEGFMDVIAAWNSGVKNGVASMGTSLTNEQIHMLDRVTDRVLIAYDGDNAGIEATKRAVDLLSAETPFDIEVASFPEGLDPDEFIKKYGTTAFTELLSHGRDTVFAFKMRYYRKGLNFQNENERLSYLDTILNEMLSITSVIERELYFKQLSSEFDISLDSLNQQFQLLFEGKKAQRIKEKNTTNYGNYEPEPEVYYPEEMPPIEVQTQKRKIDLVEQTERFLLNRLFHFEEAWIQVQSQQAEFYFAHEEYQTLFILFENFKESVGDQDSIDAFIDFVKEPQLKNLLVEIEMLSLSDEIASQEIDDYIDVIARKSVLHERLKEKQTELREASRIGNKDEIRNLTLDIVDISRQLKNK
ncbi:DNA primase [Carnobacterium gallinarum]|uniref:DNA primase n=1 Tax=Carnobacterium gallinarum TaxID=2749 RepID=UPI0005544B6C|nr:DNA primase [Carnobacterium gallinarum]